nr:PAS domain-containing hybrid sensor histidine kinase/response regulator [Cesiribacter sp. SM1]
MDSEKYVAASLIDERAEDLYENAPCGYLSTLPNGLIIKINSTLLSWLGYDREEVLFKKRLQDFFVIGGRMFYETHHAPLLKMQGRVNELNYDLLLKAGGVLPVLLNSIQLKDDAGVPQLNRVTVFNIIDRKKYELELLQAKKKAEEAAKAKATFLSTVSHEFRTPLNAIIGIASLLDKTDLTAQQAKYLDVLKFSSENLLNLINDILDFSKVEAGKIVLEEKYFHIRHLLNSILYSQQYKAQEKGITLTLQLDDALPEYMYGDSVKIGQVLTNLLSNAIKFTENGLVSLQLQLLEQEEVTCKLLFKVIDTGIGIPEDQQAKIFEEFTQASPEINPVYGGTGLGLAISQRLLSLFGSRIYVSSQSGVGSEFFFVIELPVGQAEVTQEHKAIGSEPTALKPLKGVRLLLAEDNEINVFVVSEYLRQWGVYFDVASNGAQAVELARQNTYDIVLMDLQMPVMDGYEATRAIRSMEHEQYKRLPIIAFTASARFDYKDKIVAAEITSLLTKPFRVEELYATIAKSVSLDSLEQDEECDAKAPYLHLEEREIHSGKAPISIQEYIKVTRNNRDSLNRLLLLTIKHFEQYKVDFAKALLNRDAKGMGDLAHKIKVTLQTLEAVKLQRVIASGRSCLATADKALLLQINNELQEAFDCVVVELKKHLDV